MVMALHYIATDESYNNLLEESFELTQAEGINSEWVTDVNCLALDSLTKDDFVVVGTFEGNFFQELKNKAKTYKFRIVGPLCVSSCIQLKKPLPKFHYPVHNITLAEAVVCCTSVPKDDRVKLLDMVCSMGGKVTKDFTSDVTHLIAAEVGSPKYLVATQLKKPILLPEWIHSCWENGSKSNFNGTEVDFITKFRCPIFKGYTICVSGLGDRQEIKRLVNENGGSYSPELNMRTCTHLLVKTPQGEKFEFARQWKIHCIHPDWFYECLKLGHWIEESAYMVDKDVTGTSVHCLQNVSSINSTVTGNVSSYFQRVPSQNNGNKIGGEVSKAAIVAEKVKMSRQLSSNERQGSLCKEEQNQRNVSIKDPPVINIADPLSKLKKCCNFLDGCRIFLDGFSVEHMDFLRKLVNAGGATRYNKLNDSVTHVVLGELTTSELRRTLISFDPLPIIVNGFWLLDSMKNNNCMNEEAYSLLEFHNEDKEDICSETRGKRHLESVTKMDTVLDADYGMNDDSDDDVIVQQYLDNNLKPSGTHHGEHLDGSTTGGQDDRSNLFKSLQFSIKRFQLEEANEIQQLIEENGGVVADKSEVDFVLVPVVYHAKDYIPSKNEVTVCWLEQSLEEERIFDCQEKFIYRPFCLPRGQKQLSNCVISVSQFTGIEREHLLDISSLLGACVQEYFVRTDNGNLKASTHLILKEPIGSKYEAAVKWSIPAVTDKWLFVCAETGLNVPVDRYLVDLENNHPCFGVSDDEKVQPTCEAIQENLNDFTPPEASLSQAKGSSLAPYPGKKDVALEICKDHSVLGDAHHVQSETVKKSKTPLKLSKSFRPSFDFSGAIDAVSSPPTSMSQRRKSRASRGSFPFDNLFDVHIQKGLQRTQMGGVECADGFTSSPKLSKGQEEKENRGSAILSGVILTVSKKLSHRQTELHNVASMLGAEARFILNDECTHFIHEGKIHDASRDFLQAKATKKYIVSPHWLEDCAEQQKRLQENLYPHTYNPRYSLKVLCTSDAKSEQGREAVSDESKSKEGDDSKIRENEETKGQTKENPTVQTERDGASDKERVFQDHLDLQKKLEEVMEATKAINGGLRRSKRHRALSSTNGDERMGSRASFSKRRRRQSSQKSSGDSSRSSEGGCNAHDGKTCADAEVEESQGDVIGYDDPAGRLERERILAQFKMIGCSQDMEAGRGQEKDGAVVMTDALSKSNVGDCHENSQLDKRGALSSVLRSSASAVLALSHPPIGLQIAKPVEAPVPVNLLDEEDDKEKVQPSQSPTHFFLLSSISPQEKADYSALIEQLGGKVFESSHYNPQCTHVVVGTPNRNEKFLASVAAGKWILHTSYLVASREAGYFINEADHEWGSESDVSKLAAAARRWRIRLASEDKTREGVGAFVGWKIYLWVDKSRQPGFKRLLEAGGATVKAVRPPFCIDQEVTHMFVDPSKVKILSMNLKEIARAAIPVLKPEYIAEYLTQDPSPPVEKFLLPELQQSDNATESLCHADAVEWKGKLDEVNHQPSKKLKS